MSYQSMNFLQPTILSSPVPPDFHLLDTCPSFSPQIKWYTCYGRCPHVYPLWKISPLQRAIISCVFSLMVFITSHFFFIFMNFCLTYQTTNSLEAGPCLHIAYYCVLSTQHGTWLLVAVTKYLLADKGCCFIHSSPLGQTVLIFVVFTDHRHTSPSWYERERQKNRSARSKEDRKLSSLKKKNYFWLHCLHCCRRAFSSWGK